MKQNNSSVKQTNKHDRSYHIKKKEVVLPTLRITEFIELLVAASTVLQGRKLQVFL